MDNLQISILNNNRYRQFSGNQFMLLINFLSSVLQYLDTFLRFIKTPLQADMCVALNNLSRDEFI